MQPGAYRDGLLQRIETLPPLQRLVFNLDAALTQKDPADVVGQYHHQPKTLEDWLARPGGNPIWYLSDGGYSRIVWSYETGNLFLTDNSTSRVKANWEKAAPERQALQDYLNAEYRRLGESAEAARLVENLLCEAPELDTLKAHRRTLDADEREQVIKAGAVWEPGKPGVWKAVVNGKTWYACNTHRAYQVKSTLKAAIAAFKFVSSTS